MWSIQCFAFPNLSWTELTGTPANLVRFLRLGASTPFLSHPQSSTLFQPLSSLGYVQSPFGRTEPILVISKGACDEPSKSRLPTS
jgi:hypothetical protein